MKAELLRRTFAAKLHPKGSPERDALNNDVVTSEYMPSYRYVVRVPAMMSDGTPNPVQPFHVWTFTTKSAAEACQRIKNGGQQ